MRQQCLGIGPALVLLADAIGNRHPYIVEFHFVQAVMIVDRGDGVHFYAGGFHIDQQEADTLLLFALGAGAHQTEDPVGKVGIGGPYLRACHHVVVAIAYRPGLQGGKVGARTRLGITLAPPLVAGQYRRQEPVLLRLGAKGINNMSHHFQAEWHDIPHPRQTALRLIDELPGGTPAGAAILHWPVGGYPALLVQALLPLDHGLLEHLRLV